jgi:hypothetical protein
MLDGVGTEPAGDGVEGRIGLGLFARLAGCQQCRAE